MHVSVRTDLSHSQQIINMYKSEMNMFCEILKLSRLFKVRIEQTIKIQDVVLKLNIISIFFKIIYRMYISNT